MIGECSRKGKLPVIIGCKQSACRYGPEENFQNGPADLTIRYPDNRLKNQVSAKQFVSQSEAVEGNAQYKSRVDNASADRCALLCLLSGFLTFWLMNSWGLRNIRMAIIAFFSGSLVPLGALPDWMQTLCRVLPFQSIVYTPTMIYMGQYSLPQAAGQIAVQLGWAVLLWIAVRLLSRAAIRRVSSNGG